MARNDLQTGIEPKARLANGNGQRRLIRLKEGATYLSISPGRLRREIQNGAIPVVKLSEHAPWLVDVQDLDEFVQHRKRTYEW